MRAMGSEKGREPLFRQTLKNDSRPEWHLLSLYHFASSSLRAFSRGLFSRS
jgi:hypothetical protein